MRDEGKTAAVIRAADSGWVRFHAFCKPRGSEKRSISER
jgi:hypothetical protein